MRVSKQIRTFKQVKTLLAFSFIILCNFAKAQAPSVTTQPSSATVCSGSNASFTAAASGSPSCSMQWQVSTNSGSSWSNISGATSSPYSFIASTSNSGYQYRAVFTNTGGTANSNAATLTVNNRPTVTTQTTSGACFANSSGTATANVSGGTTPYTYSWNSSPVQTTATTTGLAAGTYTVTVTGGNGCSTTATATITQPNVLAKTISSQSNIGCTTPTTGSITVSGIGGTSPYQYKIGSGSYQSSGTFSALSLGYYLLTVKDSNNCTDTQTIYISQLSNSLSSSISSQTNPICYGGATGTATVLPSMISISPTFENGFTGWSTIGTATVQGTFGGTSPTEGASQGLIVAGPIVTTTVDNFLGLPSGTISSTFTNTTGGSSFKRSITVNAGDTLRFDWDFVTQDYMPYNDVSFVSITGNSLIFLADVSTTTTSVNMTSNAFAFTHQTGYNTYTYVFATGGTYTLGFGVFNRIDNVVLSGLIIDKVRINSTYPTASNYSVSWNTSPVQTSATATGLSAGSYIATVSDSNGCTSTATATLTQPSSAISVSISSQTNVLCYGGATGALSISASGGVSPYQYKYDGGSYQSSNSFTGLTAATQPVTVKDANNCTATISSTITQNSAITVSVSSQTNVACYGGATGALSISASGGTSPYQYKYDGGSYQSSNSFSGLVAAVQPVTVKDANNCTASISTTLTQPSAALSASISSQTNVACYGNATGTLTISASGGTSPYQYKYDGGSYQSSNSFSGLVAAVQPVTVKDANNCTASISTTITQPSVALSAGISSQTNVLCYGNSTGAVTVAASGGTSVYQYKIGSGSYQSSGTFSSLAAGSYTITILDANGCNTTQAVTISQPSAALSVSCSNTSASGYGATDATVSVTANGGTSSYSYLWSNSATSNSVSGLSTGAFSVTVTDAHGCTASCTTTLNNFTQANWDATSTTEDVSVSGSVAGNDDLSGDGGNVWSLVTNPSHGSVIVTSNGGYSYAPDANYNGSDAFVYQLCDVNGDCDTAIVYITISSVNDAPVAVWNSNTTDEDTPVSGSVGGNDTDVDNNINPNGFTLTSGPSHGSLTFNNDGTYTYTPSANYNGNDQFIYQVCDLGSPIYCDTAIVYLTINPVNDAPVAVWNSNQTTMNNAVNGDVSTNDYDVDGNLNANSFAVTSNVAHGSLTFNNDGSYTYTPTTNYFGNDQFIYQVCDLGSPSLCDTAIVYLTIAGVPVTPSVSISASATTICAGTSVTFTATPTNGGTAPTYQWKNNGNNISGATNATYTTTTLANGDVITVVMTSNHPTASPTTATSNSVTMTVNAAASQPSAFTVSSSTIYWGQNPITYTVPNVSGVTYTWSYSGTGVTITGSGNSITLTPAQGSTSGTLSVTATNGCGTSAARTMAVTVLPYITWQCNSSSDWSNGSNWDAGFAPYSTINVLIPAAASCQPTLPASNCVRDLTVQANASINIPSNYTLCVNGNLNNNGNICSGTLILNGPVAQTISGNGTVCNFELNNPNGATITSGDTLKITQTYTPTDGVLNTNGGLELYSDVNGTATILEHPFSGTCTNYINGNVIVLKYIPGGRRAFRFLSHPFSTSIGLDQLIDDIDITGVGGSANGFTTTNTNNPSAFWYNTLLGDGSSTNDTGWTAYTNTNGLAPNAWDPMEGLRIYIRGEKGQGLGCTPCVPNPVTIDMLGPVNQCEVVTTLQTNANHGYNFVGNPYAANIDMSLTSRGSNVGANFSVWDPHQGIYGAYVDQPFNFSYVLPAYSAFIATASANTGNTITFNEATKVNAAPTGNLFKTTGAYGSNAVQLRILSNNDSISWDRMLLFFNPQAQAAYDKLDNKKMTNPSLDFFSIATDDSHLSINARPYVDKDIIPLGLRVDSLMNYAIKVEDYDVPAGSQIYLHDYYTNTDQALSLGMKYNFTVNSNPMSQGNNRFELRLGLINGINNINHNQPKVNITPNPATTDVAIWTNDAVKEGSAVEVRDVVGHVVYQGKLDKNMDGKFNINLQDWTSGLYFITIHSGDNTITEKLLKQ